MGWVVAILFIRLPLSRRPLAPHHWRLPAKRSFRRVALRAERRAVTRRIAEIGKASAHGTLVESGLLPNYALIDTRTALEATLAWEDRSGEDNRVFHSELREYSRPARPGPARPGPSRAGGTRPRQQLLRAGLP
ncbi:hypothetical protein, partial [Frankia sp. Cr1]|uniref:hypothetical protein n=1 Tax=Frankia sp. Cr1 TaxID=3073931 RepID=UPI002AD2A183